MLSSLSDSALSTFKLWVSWVAAGGSGLGVICAVLTIISTRETSRRASIKASELDAALRETQTKLSIAERDTKDAQELARKAHIAGLPRVLSADQREKLITATLPAPKGKIIVKANMLDSEAEVYANQIAEALVASGYEIIELGHTGIVSLHKQGGALLVMDQSNPPIHALPLQRCFSTIGIDLIVSQSKSAVFPDDAVIVWISRK